ncbi:hypothetical protein IAT38_003066 [Cryptococcus sp. DSM 104549]
MNHPHSPPLPNLHSLSISPPPGSYPNNNYRYNGVFGPPVGMGAPQPTGSPDWSSGNKRSSRSGLPSNWYDPNAPREQFDYRHDAPSPPSTLSPPSSVPTTASSNHHQAAAAFQYQPQPQQGYTDTFAMNMGMGMGTPSPPPMGYAPLGFAGGFGMRNQGGGGMGQQQQQPQQSGQSQDARRSMQGVPGGQQTQQNGWRNGYSMPSMPMSDDDVIPTAIVIKNIPFAVTRETLLAVMESLGAPLPYAFNYHHDNGVFRGLAFANFRAPEEAASVVAALNGYDVQGRKLRVEYKKVLQPGEKDKIEREKALKRMRSLQFDRKEMPPPLTLPTNRMPPPPPPPHSASAASATSGYDQSPPQSASAASTNSNSDSLPATLDMNNPMALDIYSRVLVFKEDRMRDELAFSRNLTPTERRIVHLVAQKLGLTSITRGEDESKTVVVTREPQRPALLTSTSATAAGSGSTPAAYLSPYGASPNPNPNQPTTTMDLSPNLRYKKSMPDLRGFGGPVVARDPARSLTPQRSSGNMRAEMGRDYASMGAAHGRRMNGGGQLQQQQQQQQGGGSAGLGYGGNGGNGGGFNGFFGSSIDIPPVPPLPSGLGLHSKGLSMGSISPNPAAGAPNGSGSLSAHPHPHQAHHHHPHSSHSHSNSNSQANGSLGVNVHVHSNGRVSPEDLVSPIQPLPQSRSQASSFTSSSLPSSSALPPPQPLAPQQQQQQQGSAANQTQPLRNPRGPAGESRGFGGSLWPGASRSMMGLNSGLASGGGTSPGGGHGAVGTAGTAGTAGSTAGSTSSGGAGREDEGVAGGSADAQTQETMRTRESLEI